MRTYPWALATDTALSCSDSRMSTFSTGEDCWLATRLQQARVNEIRYGNFTGRSRQRNFMTGPS